jgi:hypothetical protein
MIIEYVYDYLFTIIEQNIMPSLVVYLEKKFLTFYGGISATGSQITGSRVRLNHAYIITHSFLMIHFYIFLPSTPDLWSKLLSSCFSTHLSYALHGVPIVCRFTSLHCYSLYYQAHILDLFSPTAEVHVSYVMKYANLQINSIFGDINFFFSHRYKSPGRDQIPAELIQAGGKILRSKNYMLINNIWNKEKLLISGRSLVRYQFIWKMRFGVTDQLLIRYFAFVRYWRKIGSTKRQYIRYS